MSRDILHTNYRQEVLLNAVKVKDTLISILRCLHVAGKNKAKSSKGNWE